MITQQENHWPLVVFVCRGRLTEADFDQYLGDHARLLARGERYAAVFDAREAEPLASRLVDKQARWLEENAGALKRLSVGVAFVIRSPAIRDVLRAILSLQTIPQPYNVCETMPQALDWTVRRMRQNGLRVPETKDIA